MGIEGVSSQSVGVRSAQREETTPTRLHGIENSTIRYGSTTTSTLKEYALQTWEWIKYPFIVTWGYISWIFNCCPSEKNPIVVVQEIIANPAKQARDAAKNPREFFIRLASASLLKPVEVRNLCEENKYKMGEFWKTFNPLAPDAEKTLQADKEVAKAIFSAFLPGQQSKHDVYNALVKANKEHREGLLNVLEYLQAVVIGIIGKKGPESSELENDGPKFLRTFFIGYLTRALSILRGNSKLLSPLSNGFYSQNRTIQDLPELAGTLDDKLKMTDEEIVAWQQICENKFLLMFQLADPATFFGRAFENKEKRALEEVKLECLLRFVTRGYLIEFNRAIGDRWPVLTGTIQALVDGGDKAIEDMRTNWGEIIQTLEIIYAQKENPPVASIK